MILHIDGDNFFASCLIAQDPSLKNLPLVVGAERGIVTALSPEAKAIGITRGLPIFQVQQKFPTAVIMHGDYQLFSRVSRTMHEVLGDTSHALEKYSIDESFADITEVARARRMTPHAIAREVKERLFARTNQPFSIGVAPTKTLAKLVSTSSKPDGLRIALDDDTLTKILNETPVEKIWGVGGKTAVQLRIHGIHTALEVRDATDEELAVFGKVMHDIRAELQGHIIHPISRTQSLEKSMLSSLTFTATSDKDFIRREFLGHIDLLCARLREDDALARSVSFHVKDRDHRVRAESGKLPKYEDTPSPFIEALDSVWHKLITPGEPLRTVGVTFTDIIPRSAETPSLFDTPDTRGEKVFRAVDELRAKGHDVGIAALVNGRKQKSRMGFHPRNNEATKYS